MFKQIFILCVVLGLSRTLVAKDDLYRPTLTVDIVQHKDAYSVGEQWVCEFKATVTAGVFNNPLVVCAWGDFFADYLASKYSYESMDDVTLSDVLANGGQIYREGQIVVHWNQPLREIFLNDVKTTVPTGKTLTTNFHQHFGTALKAGDFRYKIWYAIVLEPSPGKLMLLFARKPVDITFHVEGNEVIDADESIRAIEEFRKSTKLKFHDDYSIKQNSH